MKRFWPWRSEDTAAKGSSAAQAAGVNTVASTSPESRKLAVVFYDADLNIVEKERAVYELHFFNATSLEWRLTHGTKYDTARFFIGAYASDWSAQEWANFPLNVAGDFIKNLAHDPHSQCGFAFQWINSDWPRRYRMFLSTHRGSLDECEKILTYLGYVFTPADKNWSRAAWTIKIEQSDADPWNPFLWSQIKRDFELRFDDKPIEFSDHQFKLLRITHCYFMPFYLMRVRHTQQKTRDVEWNFELPSGSHHDRLEARLQLRNWLQGKVAPEEIPFLLGEQSQ